MKIYQKNKIKNILVCFFVLANFFVVPAFASAEFNPSINYQGKLTNSSGVAVPDGLYNMRFWLLETDVIATTSAVWTESRTATGRVQVTNGLFSVMLGDVSAISGVDFNQTLYLGVEIGGISTTTPSWDGEMSPRKILGTVPAAFEAENAQTLDNLATSSFLRSDTSDTLQATSSSPLLTLIQNGAGKIMSLFSGLTEVFTVLSNGNIGVGTSTPAVGFVVDNDMALTGGLYDNNNTRGNTGSILQSTGSGLEWMATSTLGIAISDTTGVLAATRGGTGLSSITQNQLLIGGAGNTWTQIATSSLGLGNNTFLGLTDTQSSYTANRLIFTNSGATALTDSADLVFNGTGLGIGTTTPSAKLSIAQPTLTPIGSELITNGTFTGNASGWFLPDECADYSSNTVVVTYDSGCWDGDDDWPAVETSFSATAGKTYLLTFTLTGVATDTVYYYVSPDVAREEEGIFNDGTHSTVFTAESTGTHDLGFELWQWNSGGTFTIDDVSVKEVSTITPSLLVTGYDGTNWLSLGGMSSNTGLGQGVFASSDDGRYSTAIGQKALFANQGDYNTAVGIKSLFTNTTGSLNTAIGATALSSNTTADANVAVGFNSLFLNTSGDYNVAVGTWSLQNNLTGSENTAVGPWALSRNISGSSNTAIGSGALVDNTTGNENTALGASAMHGNTTGLQNTAVGFTSLFNNTTGSWNTANGAGALVGNTTGTNNTANGVGALFSNTSGGQNIAVGNWSLYSATEGWQNTAVGYQSLNNATSSASYNTALGYQAGYGMTTASNNIFLGFKAGDNLTTGSSNIVIGFDVDIASTTRSNQLNIGNLIFATGVDGTGSTMSSGNVGIGSTTVAAQKLQIWGNIRAGASGTLGCVQRFDGTALTGTCTSDRDLKTNIQNLSSSSRSYIESLVKLDPVTYNWNDVAAELYKNGTSTISIGLIAQDVESVFPELVSKDDRGYRQVDFTAFTFYTIQAIKELYTDFLAIREKVLGFADKFTTKEVETNMLCMGQTCITEAELIKFLEESKQSPAPSMEQPENTTAPENIEDIKENEPEPEQTNEPEQFIESEVNNEEVMPEVETPEPLEPIEEPSNEASEAVMI